MKDTHIAHAWPRHHCKPDKMHMLTRHLNHPQKPSTISSSLPALSPSVAPRHRKATANRLNVPSAAPKLVGKSRNSLTSTSPSLMQDVMQVMQVMHISHLFTLSPSHFHHPPALQPTCDLQDRDLPYPPAPGIPISAKARRPTQAAVSRRRMC
jgi:hypothetical protein